MHVIIVSDIFGKTKALKEFAKEISNRGSCELLDPYNGDEQCFSSEDEAYQRFSKEMGVIPYSNLVRDRITNVERDVTLIGFSAGASAIWRLSGESKNDHLKRGTLFYGSQIRNFPDVEPTFPLRLIFPKHEAHFDVDELISLLKRKNNVEVEQTEYLHGFMNPHSINFDSSAYNSYIHALNAQHK